MQAQQRKKLLVESLLFMMFRPRADVILERLRLRTTHRECAVARLPFKGPCVRKRVVYPPEEFDLISRNASATHIVFESVT